MASADAGAPTPPQGETPRPGGAADPLPKRGLKQKFLRSLSGGHRKKVAAPATPSPTAAAGFPAGRDTRADAERADAILRALADLSTAVWRMRSKLDACPAGDLPAALRSLPRHMESATDALTAVGLRLWDPTGEPYASGMAVNPLAFQPEDGLTRELIRETVKPGIYFGDNLIRRPDVIVAQPTDPAWHADGAPGAAAPTPPSPPDPA